MPELVKDTTETTEEYTVILSPAEVIRAIAQFVEREAPDFGVGEGDAASLEYRAGTQDPETGAWTVGALWSTVQYNTTGALFRLSVADNEEVDNLA